MSGSRINRMHRASKVIVIPIVIGTLGRVRTASEIKKSRVFQGCSTVLSRAFPGLLKPRIKITFTTNCLNQHLRVNVITAKQQYAPSASFQY